jgi:hypothetical protein
MEEAHGGHAIILVMNHYFLQHAADQSKMQAGQKGTLMPHCRGSTYRKAKIIPGVCKTGTSQRQLHSLDVLDYNTTSVEYNLHLR